MSHEDLIPRRPGAAALRRLIARDFAGDSAGYVAALSAAMNQAMRADLKSAGQLARRMHALTPHLPRRDRALLLRAEARYHHLSGHVAVALGLYRRAAAIYRREGDAVAAARIGRALVDVHMYMGRYREAEQIGREAARIFRRRRLELDWAQTVCNLGNLYHRQDDNSRALAAYDRALAVIRRIGEDPAVALVQLNRGNILSNLHRLTDAEACYSEAKERYERAAMPLAAAQAEYSLAYLCFLRGDIAESLERFEQVRAGFEALGDRRCAAQTQLDLLEVQLQMNLFTVVAADARTVALQFRALGMRYEQAKCWYFLARALAALEDLPGAQTALARARQLLARENNAVWLGSLDLFEARLSLWRGSPAEARGLARSAERAFRRAGDLRRQAAAALVLVDSDLGRRRLSQARRRLDPFLDSDSPYPAAQRFEAWWLDGRLRRATGRAGEAIRSYERALSVAEEMTQGIPADETRIFFLSDKIAAYHELTGLLLSRRDYPAALRVVERSRYLRRASWRQAAPIPTTDLPDPLRRREETLRSRLHRLYAIPASPGRMSALNMETVRETEDQLWRLVQRRRRLAGARSGGALHDDVPRSGAALPPGRAVIVFAADGDHPCAILLTRRHTIGRSIPITWDHLRSLLARFYFFVEKNRMPSRSRVERESEIAAAIGSQLSSLSEAVLWPLLADLDPVTDLTIVPLDLLGAVPFHALPLPDGRPLYADRTVRLTVDLATALSTAPARLPAHPVGALFSPGQDQSGEMDAEATEICELFPGSLHYRADQSRGDRLREALTGATDFLHIASHASAALDNPIFSEILLSDGPFYAFDLFNQPVRQQLVTLAACQTGRPGILPSGEVYGLAEAFLSQGAKAVLSSLWTVDDRTARAFMVEFYRNVRQGTGLNRAWATALESLRQSHDNPYHWAPYIMIGSTN